MVVLFFPAVSGSTAVLPTAEDINGLAEKAKQVAETFMQQGFKVRMQYECSGRFLTQDDKENLRKLAKSASDSLQAITKNQQRLKQQIEDYRGDDWDDKYGSTGLWRKQSSDLYTTSLSKSQVDFYIALTAKQSERNGILRRSLDEIESVDLPRLPASSQLLKARILALLAQTVPAYKPLAKKEFDMLLIRSDMRQATAFRIAIERIKLLGQTESGWLETLAEELAQSSCADDLELVLSLAFLQRRYEPASFEKILQIWPQIEDFLGSLVLSDLSQRVEQQQSLEQISVFEAELAAQAAWKNEIKDYEPLLSRLAGIEKFQTPLILYVVALAYADSSPARSVNLLVKASKLQQQQKSDKLAVLAEEIAEQGAWFAYNLFAADSLDCPPAIEAFENYYTKAREKIDEELEYLYSVVLDSCGQTLGSQGLLERIADRSAGYWRNRAELDLIRKAIQQSDPLNRQYYILFWRLSNLIADCSEQDERDRQLRTEAVGVYCQLLLESKENRSAQKVLDILTEAETARDPNLNVFKAKALQQLGRLDESARFLLSAIDPNSCELAGEAMELLSEVVDTIDRFEKSDLSFMRSCKQLTQFCYDCLEGRQRRQAGLFLAETSIFAAAKEKDKLLAVEKLLSNLANDDAGDVDLHRCRARLLTENGKFKEAAGLWAQIAEVRKSELPETSRRSWKWWRAKFYELYCWAKCPQTKKEEVLHTIEVLENTFTNIPTLWAEKLDFLKQQCRSKDDNL
jgi:hypothetical protein